MFEVGKIYRTKAGLFTKLVETSKDHAFSQGFPLWGKANNVSYNLEGKVLPSGRDDDNDLLPGAYEEVTDPHYVLQQDDLLSSKGNPPGWGFVLCSYLCRTGQTYGENMWANALRRLPDAPPKEVLRWVNDIRPDKVGLWARRSSEGMTVYTVTKTCLLYTKGEYCYLGPVPEILPALKKVRKFMWLEYLDSDGLHPGESVYKEHWIEEGEAPDVAGWLRTDKWTDVIV